MTIEVFSQSTSPVNLDLKMGMTSYYLSAEGYVTSHNLSDFNGITLAPLVIGVIEIPDLGIGIEASYYKNIYISPAIASSRGNISYHKSSSQLSLYYLFKKGFSLGAGYTRNYFQHLVNSGYQDDYVVRTGFNLCFRWDLRKDLQFEIRNSLAWDNYAGDPNIGQFLEFRVTSSFRNELNKDAVPYIDQDLKGLTMSFGANWCINPFRDIDPYQSLLNSNLSIGLEYFMPIIEGGVFYRRDVMLDMTSGSGRIEAAGFNLMHYVGFSYYKRAPHRRFNYEKWTFSHLWGAERNVQWTYQPGQITAMSLKGVSLGYGLPIAKRIEILTNIDYYYWTMGSSSFSPSNLRIGIYYMIF